MSAPTSVVIAHTPIGSGHRMAAQAVATEIEAATDGRVRVDLVDVLALGSIEPSVDSLTKTFTGPTAVFYDAVWFSPTGGTLARSLSTPALAWAYRKFTDYLLSTRPGAVVCTHALAALLTARAIKSGRLSTNLVSVTTDFGVHGFWPREGATLTCVASEQAGRDLIDRGFEPQSVAVTGIPVRPQFSVGYDRQSVRAEFGLPPQRRVLLAAAGATVAGPYSHLKSDLLDALGAIASPPDISVVVVTGNDHEYAEDLRQVARMLGADNVHVLGYVERMAPLMAASDVLMAKPGGLVCAESLAMDLPLALIGPAAGQERANVEALCTAGAAVPVNDPGTMAEEVLALLSDDSRLHAMRHAARDLARPNAAADVARRVLALVERA